MRKNTLLLSLILLCITWSCKKESHDLGAIEMTASVKGTLWSADEISAIRDNNKSLIINGLSHSASSDTIIYLSVPYTINGSYTVDVDFATYNPQSAHPVSFASFVSTGTPYAEDPVRIKGVINIEAMDSKKVKGTFSIEFIYNSVQLGFSMEGTFIAPVQ